jgi:hypothetical protein
MYLTNNLPNLLTSLKEYFCSIKIKKPEPKFDSGTNSKKKKKKGNRKLGPCLLE